MSRTIRQTALSGLLGSKRFIVAVCAAIAMVLGAMSVGASIFVPHSAADGGQQAANTPLFTERGSSGSGPSKENDGRFIKQQTLVPNGVQPHPVTPSPATNTLPKGKAGLGIEFGPVNATAGISLGRLQVKVENSLTPTIETPPILSESIEVPTIEPPKTQEEPPKEDEPPTDSPSADDDGIAPLSITSGITSLTSPEEPQP